MSGGSYNYLFMRDISRLLDDPSDLDMMAKRLAGLGYAKDAAIETARALEWLRWVDVHWTVVTERLGEVWRAVEWWDSGDSGEEAVEHALAEYRALPKED